MSPEIQNRNISGPIKLSTEVRRSKIHFSWTLRDGGNIDTYFDLFYEIYLIVLKTIHTFGLINCRLLDQVLLDVIPFVLGNFLTTFLVPTNVDHFVSFVLLSQNPFE